MLNVTSHNFNNFKTQTKSVPRPSFNPAKLSIFYYNDTHGNSDQFAGIMESAKNFKAKNHDSVSFVLSAGDNVSGGDVSKNSFVFDLHRGDCSEIIVLRRLKSREASLSKEARYR